MGRTIALDSAPMHALLLSLLLAAPAAPPPEALILGVRSSSGLATFVVSDAGIEKIGTGLAVPRKDGWWKLDEKRLTSGESFRDVLLTSKKPAAAPAFDLEQGCDEQTSIDVLFVAADWISIETASGGYCEGAAHPYASDNLMPVAFEQAADIKAAKIGAVLDKAAETALLAQGAKLQKKLADDCVSDPDPSSWGLVRSKGHWTVRGQLGYAYEACRGTHHEFDAGVAAPAKLTGPDALPKAWESYQEPGLTDVLASPSGAIVLEVTKTGLVATSGGKVVGQAPMRAPAVVMAQWAIGAANVERWKQDAPKALR